MNNTNPTRSISSKGEGGWIRSLLTCLIIAAAGAGAIYYIYYSEPTASRTTATKTTAMLVEVSEAQKGTYRPTISAMGIVKPARDVILRPRVRGEIIEAPEHFTPGGFVQQGETIVKLDPSDYRNELAHAKSELRQARSDLQVEMGRQNVARTEYKLFEERLSEENQALVLRKPQLNAARASVESARAAVKQARLDLNRTTITAPFDAHVLTQDVDLGSQVAAGDRLCRLIGLDHYWVEVQVPLSKLRWISIPDGEPGQKGAPVRIRDRNAWPEDTYRNGHIHRLIEQIGERTKMARLLIEIPDPFARTEGPGNRPVLMIDAPVQALVRGKKIRNAVKIERAYLRKQDTVWVMTPEDNLDIRKVDVVFRDEKHAYIGEGLKNGERIVTTNLATVTDGAPLRLGTSGENGENAESGETQ